MPGTHSVGSRVGKGTLTPWAVRQSITFTGSWQHWPKGQKNDPPQLPNYRIHPSSRALRGSGVNAPSLNAVRTVCLVAELSFRGDQTTSSYQQRKPSLKFGTSGKFGTVILLLSKPSVQPVGSQRLTQG